MNHSITPSLPFTYTIPLTATDSLSSSNKHKSTTSTAVTSSSILPTTSNSTISVDVKVYSPPQDHHYDSHSYILDDYPVHGLSSILCSLSIDIKNISLKNIRVMLMYDHKNGMMKRNLIFQHVLFIMNRLNNIYNRPKEELTQYRFAFIKKKRDRKPPIEFEQGPLGLKKLNDEKKLSNSLSEKDKENNDEESSSSLTKYVNESEFVNPLIIVPKQDEEKPLADIIGIVELFTVDLCIVPISQISPNFDAIYYTQD